MTLDQIETFLTVADQGSFKAASEVLHRSQPALSISVKKLEEELGIKLFNRDNYRPSLTPNGRAFYRKAKDFHFQGRSLEKFGHQLGLGEEPEISLAVDGLVPISFLTSGLARFSLEHPNTQLNLSFDVLGGAMEKLGEGKAQMAITPRVMEFSPDMEVRKIGKVAMIPVVGKKVRNQLENDLSPQRMKNIPQIIVRDTSSRPSSSSHGILEGGRRWTVQDMQTKKEIILSGLGWGRLPDHYIQEELEKGSVLEVSVGNAKRENIELFLVASGHQPMGPLSQKLWHLLSQENL
ncbi:MAG: LysR family transcriptional regulator [Halobacteriovoraceae bacterium]|nr:LysR family transcriptional regulator [Halobacteriovoraceae bacterium]